MDADKKYLIPKTLENKNGFEQKNEKARSIERNLELDVQVKKEVQSLDSIPLINQGLTDDQEKESNSALVSAQNESGKEIDIGVELFAIPILPPKSIQARKNEANPYSNVNIKGLLTVPDSLPELYRHKRVKWALKASALESQASQCIRLVESEFDKIRMYTRLLRLLGNDDYIHQTRPFPAHAPPVMPTSPPPAGPEESGETKNKLGSSMEPNHLNHPVNSSMISLPSPTPPLIASPKLDKIVEVSAENEETEIHATQRPPQHDPYLASVHDQLTALVQACLDHSRLYVQQLQGLSNKLNRQARVSTELMAQLKQVGEHFENQTNP